MALYSQQGYEVFIPVDNSRVDFIALKDNEPVKVQVKTAAKRRGSLDHRQYTVGILTATRNGQRLGYGLEEIDEFCIVDIDRAFIIPQLLVYPRTTIMLDSTDPNYHPAHGFNVTEWVHDLA